MEFKNRVALVTGASQGIGKTIALKLASLGANVVINYIGDPALAEQTAIRCKDYGVEVTIIQADVSKMDECQEMFRQIIDNYGKLDILVNNAGITRDNLLLKMSEEDFDNVIAVNLKGAFLCMKFASKIMMKKRYGKIINISSVVGLRGNAGQVNYAASKAGLVGMTKSLAKELAKRGINVNAIAPGFIITEMTDRLPEDIKSKLLEEIPLGYLAEPVEVAEAVAFLASDRSKYITGQVLSVDGGMNI